MIALPMRGAPTVAGGWGFHRLFRKWLTERAIPWTSDYRGTAVLVNGWAASFWRVVWAKAHGARIVHRLDGSGAAYGRHDGATVDRRMRWLNQLADVTIYQSAYCSRVLRPLGFQPGPVIYNPVDLDLFYPAPQRYDKVRPCVAVVAWSGNPMKGLDETAGIICLHPEVDFAVIGPYPIAEWPNVHWHGVVNHAQLSGILRRCDALLTLSKHEACPNHVIEALASGVPVIFRYEDCGAIYELTANAGLIHYPETGMWDFKGALDAALRQDSMIRDRARKRAEENHDPNLIFPRYLEALTR